MTREVIFVGAEEKTSKKTGNKYWTAAFLDGMGMVEMFLDDSLIEQIKPVHKMERVNLELEVIPSFKREYQVRLVGVSSAK